MTLEAFAPSGNTVLVAASSSTGVAATQLSTTPGVSHAVRVSYPSTGAGVPIYVAFGSSAVAASVPTTALPSAGIPIAAGDERVFTMSPSTVTNWISAVTSAGAAAPGLFATPGSFGR
jgi:hypothetical protein